MVLVRILWVYYARYSCWICIAILHVLDFCLYPPPHLRSICLEALLIYCYMKKNISLLFYLHPKLTRKTSPKTFETHSGVWEVCLGEPHLGAIFKNRKHRFCRAFFWLILGVSWLLLIILWFILCPEFIHNSMNSFIHFLNTKNK